VKLLAIALALGLTLLTGAAFGAHALAAPPGDGLLPTTTHVTYDVRPDNGPVRVTWDVSVTNNDPSTVFNPTGTSQYYASYPVPVLRGASNMSASAAGGSLGVSTDDQGDPLITVAYVSMGDGLFYGESFSFTFSYEMPSARYENLLVTPAYVYIPALTTGDSTTISVVTPEDGDWQSNVEALACAESSAGEYSCSAPDEILVGAIIEVLRPGLLDVYESTVDLPGQFPQTEIRIDYFSGDETWAEHVAGLAARVLPLYDSWFSLAGVRAFTEITERGQLEIAGYGGRAACPPTGPTCYIELSPLLDDLGVLHEFAHLWTPIRIEQAWIGEGLAEYLSRRAAAELGIAYSDDLTAGYTDAELKDILGPESLHGWQPGYSVLNASADQLDEVYAGYAASLRFFQTLEETVGAEPLLEAYDRSATCTTRDSGCFLDALEDRSGLRLDDLFLDRVFPSSFASTLEERREARARLRSAREVAMEAGLDFPERVATDVAEWRFRDALDTMDAMQPAIDSYAAAKVHLDQPRSWIKRFGLHGNDPEAGLREAERLFLIGEYAQSIERSEQAAATVDEAQMAGVYRLAVAVTMFVVVVGGFVVAVMLGRRSRRSAATAAGVRPAADAGSAARPS
jgi:hypothetical protein